MILILSHFTISNVPTEIIKCMNSATNFSLLVDISSNQSSGRIRVGLICLVWES